jgi:hypothetical protein
MAAVVRFWYGGKGVEGAVDSRADAVQIYWAEAKRWRLENLWWGRAVKGPADTKARRASRKGGLAPAWLDRAFGEANAAGRRT